MKSTTSDDLKFNCNTPENLTAYLRRKGISHKYYKCYSSLNRIADIRDSKSIYLSNGENWNDVIDRNDFNGNNGNCFWRLRSPGDHQSQAAVVSYDGDLYENGRYGDHRRTAVRPALWIDLNS